MRQIRKPDKWSAHARAWEALFPPSMDTRAFTAWLISGRFHPAWNWWMIGAISTADEPDIEGDFALRIASLDPDQAVDPDRPPWKVMSPWDFVREISGITGDQLKALVEYMVDQVVDGHMSPDSDFRTSWDTLIDQWLEQLAQAA